jgi:lipopolysaccharide transport system permease protein
LVALLAALGTGLWLTALTVKYRDFRFIVPFLVQAGVFLTPVGFRTDFYPNWRPLMSLNPMTGVVDGFRWCLLGDNMPFYWLGFLSSLVLVGILLGSGLWYFRRMERAFADII